MGALTHPADQLRALIPQENALLILGVQRTGTTLLAQDIASLKAIGTPGEHYLDAQGEAADREGQFADFARRGAAHGGNTFAVTLMSNYLAGFGRWLVPGGESAAAGMPYPDLEDIAMRFYCERFQRLTVVTLLRLPIWKAAYSHWRVTVTNQYHHYAEGVRTGQRVVNWRPGDPIVPDPVGILALADKIKTDYARIADILNRHDINPIELTYDEVTTDFPGYLSKVAKTVGREDVDVTTARRLQIKLTPKAELTAAKAALEAHLGMEIE